jgi:DNA polymerase III subunit delta'
MFIGHKKVINILDKSLAANKVSQAYLFSGPESVGKFTLAKIYALAVILGAEKINPELLKDYNYRPIHYPDLIVMEPPIEEKKGTVKEKEIKAEMLRDILKELLLYPYSGKMRVLIINNAHKMNRTAQNVLLKTLEEPNDTSVIILITHQEGLLVSTIKSRCQKINFSLVSDEEILKTSEIMKARNTKRNNYFLGRPGFAFQTNDESKDNEEEIINQLISISKLSLADKFDLSAKISGDIISAKKIFEKYTWKIRLESFRINNETDFMRVFSNIQFVNECLGDLSNTNANARLAIDKTLLELK